MDVRRAVLELAAWSDVPGRTTGFASAALRAQAVALVRAAFPSREPTAEPIARPLGMVPA